jgi:hypothetical protein
VVEEHTVACSSRFATDASTGEGICDCGLAEAERILAERWPCTADRHTFPGGGLTCLCGQLKRVIVTDKPEAVLYSPAKP